MKDGVNFIDEELNEEDISALSGIFSRLSEWDYEDHLNTSKQLGINTGPLDPASKGPVLESNKFK